MSGAAHWVESDARWFELRMQYCALCGKVIPSRVWQVAIDGAERIFCDAACEALYRSYLMAQPAAGQAPASAAQS